MNANRSVWVTLFFIVLLIPVLIVVAMVQSEPKQQAASLPTKIKLTLSGPVTSPAILKGHYLFKSTGFLLPQNKPFFEAGSEDLDGNGHYTFKSVFNVAGSVCLLTGEGTYELHGQRGLIRGVYRTESGTCGTGGDDGVIEVSKSGASFYAASTETGATFLVEFERKP